MDRNRSFALTITHWSTSNPKFPHPRQVRRLEYTEKFLFFYRSNQNKIETSCRRTIKTKIRNHLIKRIPQKNYSAEQFQKQISCCYVKSRTRIRTHRNTNYYIQCRLTIERITSTSQIAFEVRNRFLFCGSRPFIHRGPSRTNLLHYNQSTLFRVHLEKNKTLTRLLPLYYWKNIQKTMKD